VDGIAFTELISGQRRGLIPALQRCGLSALSLGYGLAVRLRNRLFDLGWKTQHRVGVPVISVGNITAGGTGKTPFVAFLANWLISRDVNVVLLSRGYRALTGGASVPEAPATDSQGTAVGLDADERTSDATVKKSVNDEKLVLDRLCPGVPHLQQPDRVASAKAAIAHHAAQLLVLDDGFQHRRMHRDLDIVLIDALNPFGYDRLLPRGLLREPLHGLRRADVIVLTRADQCSPQKAASVRETIRQMNRNAEIVEVAFRPDGLINAAGRTADRQWLHGEPVIAFCGIGNPQSFQQTLSGYDVRAFRTFADHHPYTPADLAELERTAEHHGAAAVLTTLKDLVKINRTELGGRPLWAVEISTHITTGRELLEKTLSRFLRL